MRKYHTQMSDKEKQAVKAIIRNGIFAVNPYTKKRMEQRRISNLDIALTINKGDVIEVHNNIENEIRALLRLRINNRDCCVVVCINRPKVVTCYWNDKTDNHKTLDYSVYNWNVNLLPILEKAERRGNIHK